MAVRRRLRTEPGSFPCEQQTACASEEHDGRKMCLTTSPPPSPPKSVRLCDEAALLAAMVYVDLNPIRAGWALTPEASDFTSVQRRIESLDCARDSAARPDAWLTPIELNEATTAPGPQSSISASASGEPGRQPPEEIRLPAPPTHAPATKVACRATK